MVLRISNSVKILECTLRDSANYIENRAVVNMMENETLLNRPSISHVMKIHPQHDNRLDAPVLIFEAEDISFMIFEHALIRQYPYKTLMTSNPIVT
jgi:hypothetical protein